MRRRSGAFSLFIPLTEVGHALQRAKAANQDGEEDQGPAKPGELDIAGRIELSAFEFRRRDEEHGQRKRCESEGPDIAKPVSQPEQLGTFGIIVGQFRVHRTGRNFEGADRHAGEGGDREYPYAHLHVGQPGRGKPGEDEEKRRRQGRTENERMPATYSRPREVRPSADEGIGDRIHEQGQRNRAGHDSGRDAKHLIVE